MDDDDYEKSNAREWDLSYKTPATTHSGPAKQTNEKREQRGTPNRPPALNAGPRKRQSLAHAQPAWLKDGGARRRQQPRQEPQTLLIDLGDDGQNSAEKSWRDQERPVASISIPDELVWRDQHHEALARRHGAFIFTQEHPSGGSEVKFDIWGDADAVRRTKQSIHDWIQRETPSKRALGKATFHKYGSLLPQQRKIEEKRWAREVRRQRFRQKPPFGTEFGAIGTFHWPVQDYQPHEVLGKLYEALDPIRMECSCYVVFEESAQAFQIMGDADAVKHALIRMRKAYFQIAARQIAPIRRYFLRFDDGDGDDSLEIPSSVVLEPFDRIKRIAGNNTIAQEPARTPRGEREHAIGTLKDQVLAMSNRNVETSGKSILLMIAKLHYFRGHLTFRIRLGTFLATHYKATEDGKYAIDDFEDMLQQSQFAGEVTTEYVSTLRRIKRKT